MMMIIKDEQQARLESLAEYVRHLADRMRLRDHEFEVGQDDGLADDELAAIDIVPRRRLARIRVGKLFFEVSPEDRRHGLVHELVHAHLQPIRDVAATIGEELSGSARRPFFASHDNAIETATDEWAATVAPLLPTWEQWSLDRETGTGAK